MINELHELNLALREAGIAADAWHRKYLPIANIKSNAPCLRIVLDRNRVAEIEQVAADKGSNIRRYGDNQGSFPAMNLAALYRITDEDIKKEILQLIKDDGDYDICRIDSWCVTDNWSKNFRQKFKINIEARPQELQQMLQGGAGYEPINDLIEAVQPFVDPNVFRTELKEAAFAMLKARRGTAAALQTLFYLPTEKEIKQEEYGKLSVVLDTYDLEDQGLSTVGSRFAKDLNIALLHADQQAHSETASEEKDAFGRSFSPLDEPMPKVKLAAGFDVSLRTMFKGQPCQYRYGKIENDSYPISKEERTELSAALDWVAKKEYENKTWVFTGKGEAMFVFPSSLNAQIPDLAAMYQNTQQNTPYGQALFVAKAKSFAEYVAKTKELDPEHVPEWIQFFILRKLDKARTKVVYSYNAKPDEIVRRSDDWIKAAKNLPEFHFGAPKVPFPLRIADTLNNVWKQDGTPASDKYEEVTTYYGMEMFFGTADLNRAIRSLMKNAVPLGAYAGTKLNSHQIIKNQLPQLKSTLALMGMLLFWKNIRKDVYMNEYPYLFGQLLKAADGLHELYCMTERKGQLPPQLVGSGMYQAAMEFPSRTLAQLVQRLSPYLGWARTHAEKSFPITRENGETVNSPRAAFYLSVFNEIAGKLSAVLSDQTRFSDVEKAQLFIGYLASFPKRQNNQETEEDQTFSDMKGDSSNE